MSIKTAVINGVASIEIARPEKKNALTQAMYQAMADALVAAANKSKTDLIVMASHGRSGIKRLLLGSETQHVLTHGKTPVLVLR